MKINGNTLSIISGAYTGFRQAQGLTVDATDISALVVPPIVFGSFTGLAKKLFVKAADKISEQEFNQMSPEYQKALHDNLVKLKHQGFYSGALESSKYVALGAVSGYILGKVLQ